MDAYLRRIAHSIFSSLSRVDHPSASRLASVSPRHAPVAPLLADCDRSSIYFGFDVAELVSGVPALVDYPNWRIIVGESGRDPREEPQDELVDRRTREEFERVIRTGGEFPSWDTLYYFRECDDLMPIDLAEAVYNLASSAFDFADDPAPITYRNAVRILWELKTAIDGPLNDSE